MNHMQRNRAPAGPLSREPAKQRAVYDESLVKSEEWLRLAAQGAQMGLWYWNEVTKDFIQRP